nr:hypothetical protein [Variovorax boronicumulans]
MDAKTAIESLKAQLAEIPADQALRAGGVLAAIRQLEGSPPNLKQVLLKFHVRVAAGIVANVNRLTGWLVAALGAALAHIVSNWETTKALVDADALRYVMWLYVWIFSAHMLQRVFGLFVENCVAGLEVGKEGDIDGLAVEQVPSFIDGMKRPYVRPFSWIMQKGLDGILAGRFEVTGERAIKAAQILVVLGVVQMALAAVAIWSVARGLG